MTRLLPSLRPIDWAVVALLVALAPALLFPRPAWLSVLALPAALAAARFMRDGRVAPASPLGVPVALLLLTAALSALSTPSLALSAGKLGGIALGALVLWGVLVFAHTRRALLLVVAGFLACGALIAVLSLLGTTWEVKIELMRPIASLFPVRWKGLPGAEDGFNANPVGATMTMFVAVAAFSSRHLFSRDAEQMTRYWRYPAAVATAALAVLGLGVLVLSQSRGAWLGFGCGTAAVWICARRSWLAWFGAGLVVAVVGAIIAASLALSGALRVPSSFDDAIAVQGRGELWSRGLMVVRDFPMTGVGPNVFRTIVPVAYPTFQSPPTTPVPHAHNGFIQTAVDIGLPGLAAYIAIWTAILVMLARQAHGSPDAGLKRLARGLLVGAVAIAVFQLTDAIPIGAKVGTLWWVMAGLAATAAALDGPAIAPGRSTAAVAAWLLGSSAAVMVASAQPVLGLGLAALGGIACGWLAIAHFDFTAWRSLHGPGSAVPEINSGEKEGMDRVTR